MTARYIVSLLLAMVPLSGVGQSQDRYAVTAQQVARALSEKGLKVEGAQVSLAASVVANESNPKLEVRTVDPVGNSKLGERSEPQSWIRVECRDAGVCLPFYAVVRWPATAAGTSPGALGAVQGKGLEPADEKIVIHAGTHATLVMDDGRSHIQITVIALESGITGHTVRASSPDHKQVYVAEVVNAHLLRRSF